MAEAVPTKIEGRGNEVNQRITVIRQLAKREELHPKTNIEEDEHYWYLVSKAYSKELRTLKKHFDDKDKIRKSAIESAVENAEEKYHLEKKAAIDGLTGAWSRSSLDNYLERTRHLRQDSSGQVATTGLMLMDIDGFKEINDVRGHLAGDKALKDLVGILKGKTRGTDMDARYGGDEFAIVMPYIPSEELAIERAKEIGKAVQEQTGLTVTIGVTLPRQTDRSIEDIYARADRNLYQAKQAGKNLVASDSGIVKPSE